MKRDMKTERDEERDGERDEEGEGERRRVKMERERDPFDGTAAGRRTRHNRLLQLCAKNG